MKSLKLSLLAAIGALSFGAAAHAEDKPVSVTFNVGAATDYVFRGVSQTDENAQIYGGADATLGKIGYAGVWLSNVDFNNGTSMEYDLYAGIKPTVGPVALDLGVIRYGYTNQPSGPHEDYVEWKVAGSVPAGPATIGAAVYYSDDFFGETGPATYYELNGSSPIPNTKFSVSGAVGRQIVKGPLDYTTWNLGVGYAINDHIGLDLRYWDTDEHSFGSIYDSRAVLGIKATF
ncbi:TorF family putative porin [Phenylobacterium soli]|uniref:Porin n=1 Tax=Phenylobacterium soli TaxID=2170551 RepID=A0A328AN47_9CAUL|nr:TorF family putative porin [Phenylobacterium soli]RAK54854.1 hypothetical protein DJ017_10115 [Phenylobacterium soli]